VYVPSAGVQPLVEPLELVLDPLLEVLDPLLDVLEPPELDDVLEPPELDDVLDPLLELLLPPDEDEQATDPVPSATVAARRTAPRPTR
jgi:hypothetical protein